MLRMLTASSLADEGGRWGKRAPRTAPRQRTLSRRRQTGTQLGASCHRARDCELT
jgi:hypothetical protein